MTREIHLLPMPSWMTAVKPLWRPSPAPIFPFEDGPTDAERSLARKLFRELDSESQEWHRRSNPDLFAGL